MAPRYSDKIDYQRLARDEEGQASPEPILLRSGLSSTTLRICFINTVIMFSAVAGFLVGTLWAHQSLEARSPDYSASTAPRIPVPYTKEQFVYNSPFSLPPPHGEGSGEKSEPIWDALVPNGLGYFRDDDLAPRVSIPTTFHQLHCLYVLRRAYYSTTANDELETFDLGKNRTIHAAHCFDYLKQTITCSVDSTVEPYESDPNTDGFLGSGFARQCRSFEALKQYVEKWRVFNATGFLAEGIGHGKAHVHGDK